MVDVDLRKTSFEGKLNVSKLVYLCDGDFCLSKISPTLYLHSVVIF